MPDLTLKNPTNIPDEEIPRFVRRCHDRYMSATTEQRQVETTCLGMYVGGKLQWRPGETEKREENRRPWESVNRLRPAVDQVVNEARTNPPGPEADPVGSGADRDGADILEGLIREYEYRSNATETRVNALTYACAGGRGLWEMATEFVEDRSLEQQIKLKYVDNPANYFYDPDSRLPGRPDSMWGGSIRKFSRETLIMEYGSDLKVLNKGLIDNITGGGASWIRDAFGWQSDLATTQTWSGGVGGRGEYFVCEFYMIKITPKKLRLYTDHILRFDDDTIPEGVEPVDGDNNQREVPIREVWKYVVTALDVIKKTKWLGTIVPHFWVMGPEIWVDGKLYRLTLIDGGIGPQRLLNYTTASIAEIIGGMTKSPWVGFVGQFNVRNAQGINPWDNPNQKMYQYLEVKPVFATDSQGVSHLLPPPQRNTWEAPVAMLMEVGTWCAEQIKAATSVFFDPTSISARQVQSGEAIKALQAQTNVGTSNWQDALHNTVKLEYWQASLIFPQIYDGTRVRTIVRPDTQHELVEINREFPPEQMEGSKHRKADGTLEPTNNIQLGKYSLRVKAGPSVETRTKDSLNKILEAVKIAPQILQSPESQASLIRMIGEGNPEVDSFADGIAPEPGDDVTPQQMQQQIAKLSNVAKSQAQVIQILNQKIEAKLPQLEVDKWKAALKAWTDIATAEISASKDADNARGEQLANAFQSVLQMAHESATQAVDHEHQKGLADQNAANTMA